MAACCGCCAALRPRYKRLVDSIFPADPQDGLVKSNMDKLTFFAMKSPEKLDRIGEYLAHRVSRDIHRQRTGFVVIAMEALDTLLVTCHAHTLNLFVESFLKMVQKLLECNEPELQCLATSSFVKFANIQEDTPSYHRRYDFFIAKFSAMCHNNHNTPDVRERMRVSGLRGVQGVVRKTASDDLQTDIWEAQHMEKIVPSLLFNMHDSRTMSTDAESPKEEEHPAVVAETVFRDLVCRASYGNIHSIIQPVLRHLDNHNLWDPNEFAVKCFKIIMYSVQAQYGYVVVQNLMSHLDKNSKKHPKIKSGIVDVLAETVLIAAGGSIGPSVLEVFNTLLRHLRVSIDNKQSDPGRMNDEKDFQEAVINTIGEFANNLPDYQKIDIMMFVMSKVPMPTDDAHAGDSKDVLLQTMLMKTLLKVATKYKTVLMVNAFPSSFLEPLLRMSLVQDPGIRRIVQEILHTLLDRHDNSTKLRCVRPDNPEGDKVISIPKNIAQLNLTVEKPPRQDIMFMKKNGSQFYWHISENTQQVNNRVDNFEALYCTLALLCIEMGGDEILIELFRLTLGMQALTCSSNLPITHKCAIHALIAAYLNLMSQLTAIPALCQHIDQVIETRKMMAPFYLPEVAFNRSNTASSYPLEEPTTPELLFDMDAISEALRSSGHDTSRLSAPFIPQPAGLVNDQISSTWKEVSFEIGSEVDTGLYGQRNSVDLTAKSLSDIHSMSFEIDSCASTPGMHRKFEAEDITFDSMKKVLELNPKAKEEQEARRRQILENFRNAPFEDIVARSEAKSQQFQDKLNEILDMIAKPQESPGGTPRKARVEEESIPLYDMQFPELFVY